MRITRADMEAAFAASLRDEFIKRELPSKLPEGLADVMVNGIAGFAAELAAGAAEAMRDACADLAADMGDLDVADAIRNRIKV